MLVVSRKRNQKIMIRDDIEITVIDIRQHQVKIGIEAPRDIPVHRREVYDRIQAGEPPRHPPKDAEKDAYEAGRRTAEEIQRRELGPNETDLF